MPYSDQYRKPLATVALSGGDSYVKWIDVDANIVFDAAPIDQARRFLRAHWSPATCRRCGFRHTGPTRRRRWGRPQPASTR